MADIKVLLQQIKLTFPITLALMGFTQVQAQSVTPVILVQRSILSSSGQLNRPLIFETPPPPPDVGASSDRGQGASRGCNNKALIALAPVYDQPQHLVWGLTTKEYPTFWFYIPDSLTPDHSGEFSLENENQEDIYKTPVTVTGTLLSVVSVPLPPTVPPLEIGKKYHWFFRVICDRTDSSSDIVIDGWLQRIKPEDSLKKQLENAATPRERARLYAKAGVWYDSITELCRSDSKNTNFAADWAALLQAIHLDKIAKDPLVQCSAAKP